MEKCLSKYKTQFTLGIILMAVLVAGLIKAISQGNLAFVLITIAAIGLLIKGVIFKLKSCTNNG